VALAALGPGAADERPVVSPVVPPVFSGGCDPVWEGNGGTTAMHCWVDRTAASDRVLVHYETFAGTAVPGVDYVASEGMLTFEPGTTHLTTEIPVIGDTDPEGIDTLTLRLASSSGAGAVGEMTSGYILNDDPLPVGGDLSHGFVYRGDLASPGRDRKVAFFRAALHHPATYEVVVDEVSADALPLMLEIPGAIPPQQGEPVGVGTVRSLRFDTSPYGVPAALPVVVYSGGCGTDCGPDDRYRLRFYETTLAGGRINNAGGTRTVVVLQNPGDRAVQGRIHFWTEKGGYAAFLEFQLDAHGSVALDTAGVMPEKAGSATVTHDAPYGVLQGKAMSFDVTTGFASDSFLQAKPR
jgi:hypothetical protein